MSTVRPYNVVVLCCRRMDVGDDVAGHHPTATCRLAPREVLLRQVAAGAVYVAQQFPQLRRGDEVVHGMEGHVP